MFHKPTTPRLRASFEACVEIEELFSRFLQDSPLHVFQTTLGVPHLTLADTSLLTTFSLLTDGRRGWMCCVQHSQSVDGPLPTFLERMRDVVAPFFGEPGETERETDPNAYPHPFDPQPFVMQAIDWCGRRRDGVLLLDADPRGVAEAAFESHFATAPHAQLSSIAIATRLECPGQRGRFGSLRDEAQIREDYLPYEPACDLSSEPAWHPIELLKKTA